MGFRVWAFFFDVLEDGVFILKVSLFIGGLIVSQPQVIAMLLQQIALRQFPVFGTLAHLLHLNALPCTPQNLRFPRYFVPATALQIGFLRQIPANDLLDQLTENDD